MEEKEKDSYEVLLEKIDALENRIAAQDKTIKEVTDFNRALLARNKNTSSTQDVDLDAKFKKYLEGE